jgi:hypothetical protein
MGGLFFTLHPHGLNHQKVCASCRGNCTYQLLANYKEFTFTNTSTVEPRWQVQRATALDVIQEEPSFRTRVQNAVATSLCAHTPKSLKF